MGKVCEKLPLSEWINGSQMWNPHNAHVVHNSFPRNVDNEKSGIQLFFKIGDHFLSLFVGFKIVLNLIDTMDDCRMIAVSNIGTYLGKRNIEHGTAQVHGDLSGIDDLAAALVADDICRCYFKLLRYHIDNDLRCNDLLFVWGDNILEYLLGQLQVDILFDKIGVGFDLGHLGCMPLEQEHINPKVRYIPIENTDDKINFGYIKRKRDGISPISLELIEYVKEHL